MSKYLKYSIENKYGISKKNSWIRVENPTNYYETIVGLDKISDEEYVYRISGYFRPILNQNLFRKDIAQIISKLVPEQIEIKPIKITRKSTGEFWSDYYEITPLKKFSNSEYDEIKSDGLMIFYVDYSIYLSEQLKELINNELKSDEIDFREGNILMA